MLACSLQDCLKHWNERVLINHGVGIWRTLQPAILLHVQLAERRYQWHLEQRTRVLSIESPSQSSHGRPSAAEKGNSNATSGGRRKDVGAAGSFAGNNELFVRPLHVCQLGWARKINWHQQWLLKMDVGAVRSTSSKFHNYTHSFSILVRRSFGLCRTTAPYTMPVYTWSKLEMGDTRWCMYTAHGHRHRTKQANNYSTTVTSNNPARTEATVSVSVHLWIQDEGQV